MKRECLATGGGMLFVAATSCLAVWFVGTRLTKTSAELVRNSYALDWSSAFVIEHLKQTDNQWPRGWDDLRDEYDTLAEPSHDAWSFEELQSLVTIDWNADPAVLAEAESWRDPPFPVITLPAGPSSPGWDGGVANRRVFEYLRSADLAPE